MALLLDALSWLFLGAGSLFVVIGNVGLVRLPDFYTRLHAAGITDTMGAGLMLLGMTFQAGWTLITVKLVLITLFVLLTSPTAAHALAKSALHGKLKPLLHDPGGGPSTK
ncbi:MAG: sodium:proton antiporter [Proteobacteria bacterium]|nr:MAG: sodium:proton antiporter [Pseudomonadota bacterium]